MQVSPSVAHRVQSEEDGLVGADTGAAASVKFAVTLRATVIGTVQLVVVPEQSPLQPANTLSAAGVAVKVTIASDKYVSLQSVPQLIPAGLELTLPVPDKATVSGKLVLPLTPPLPDNNAASPSALLAARVEASAPAPAPPPPQAARMQLAIMVVRKGTWG